MFSLWLSSEVFMLAAFDILTLVTGNLANRKMRLKVSKTSVTASPSLGRRRSGARSVGGGV